MSLELFYIWIHFIIHVSCISPFFLFILQKLKKLNIGSYIYSSFTLWLIYQLLQLESFSSFWVQIFICLFLHVLCVIVVVIVCVLCVIELMSNSVTPWTAACQAPLSFTISRSLFKFMSIESVMLFNHLIFCPLLHFLPSTFPSIRVFFFPLSRLFTSGGQSIEASASVLPVNIQGWFPLGLTGLTSFQSKGLSRVFSNTTVWKHQFFGAQLS